jgi:pimeloyl-ACP methyl ester carboxylesterase
VLGELSWLAGTRWLFKLLLNAENPKPLPDAFVDRMYDDADWGLKRGVLALYRATDDPGEFAERVGPAFAAVRRPALVIWGAGDPYLPVRYAGQQSQWFEAEVHVLDRAGHWPMIDEPERVRELVVDFLRRQLAKSPNGARGPSASLESVRS